MRTSQRKTHLQMKGADAVGTSPSLYECAGQMNRDNVFLEMDSDACTEGLESNWAGDDNDSDLDDHPELQCPGEPPLPWKKLVLTLYFFAFLPPLSFLPPPFRRDRSQKSETYLEDGK